MTVAPAAPPTSAVEPDVLSAHTLLGCLVRELGSPDGQVALDGGRLLMRLPHTGRLLRARTARISPVGAHRFTGPVQCLLADSWCDIGLDDLTALTRAELRARTGHDNDEFAEQVRASRDTLGEILAARPAAAERAVPQPAATYLDSEQALLAGHPRHPAPKWRSGDRGSWRSYSPEGRTAFPLRWLAVPEELVHEHAVDGDFDVHANTAELLGNGTLAPPGCRLLPVHPWQFSLLVGDPELGPLLSAAVRDGALHDLGAVGATFHPTASVRTLYQPDVDVFLKTSLHVRITNCVRKNAAYELAGAVELTRLLATPVADVAAHHPGFGVLPEPAARSLALPDGRGTAEQRHRLLEGLGTIVRAGVGRRLAPGEHVHVAGTLAAAEPDPAGTRTRLADLADPADPREWARQWWRRYLALLVPPVLRLWADHGIVLEPHPQNVLAVLDAENLPAQVLARDLEGTKLLERRHAGALAALPPDVARAAAYDEERGWHRIAYCLFVNHLTEIAGALADLAPAETRVEAELWSELADVVSATSADLDHPPRLRALLAGVPLPAKTNLLTRWERAADRQAGYVPFPHPLRRAWVEPPR